MVHIVVSSIIGIFLKIFFQSGPHGERSTLASNFSFYLYPVPVPTLLTPILNLSAATGKKGSKELRARRLA